MLHKTDRNIVLASSMHQALDISFGPSDDDFHYQRHHGTISHEQAVVDANEIDIKLIFQGGGCEIQWSGSKTVRNETHWDGFLSIGSDGGLSFPFGDDDGNRFYVEFNHDGLRVWNREDAPHDSERDKWLVFDSSQERFRINE
jgi:hypothetical protein